MRTLIISLIIFILLIALWFFIMDYMDESIDELLSLQEEIHEFVVLEDWQSALKRLDYFNDRWNTHQAFYHLFLNQENIMQVNYAISKTKIYMIYEESALSLGQLSFIEDQLNFIHEDELISIENIF